MNLIWNKNLSLFKTRFPALAEMMKTSLDFYSRYAGTEEEAVQLSSFWSLSTSKTGSVIAAENALRLHSAYNPEREAQTAVASRKDEIDTAKAIVFCAMGLGYSVLEAAEIWPDKTIVVIEPDLNHLLASFLYVDFEKLFHHPSIIFAAGCTTDQAITLLNQYGLHNCAFFSVPSQTSHAAAWFSQLDTLVKRNLNKEDINNATLEKFRALWFRNSKRNIEKTALLEGVNIYRDKAGNLPFLILAAGPSLDKILPYLHELKKRMVTVCVDTALRSCLRIGYEPDFIMLTDPQYWAWRHIAGLKSPSSVLIAENAVYPSVFRFKCRKIICCSSQIPYGQFFEHHIEDFGSLGAGGSVASCAWNFAKLCGAKVIFAAGLDLAFPGKLTHIKGSTFEQASHTNSNRIKTAETANMPMLFSGNASVEKDYNGRPVLSDQRMKMFAWWFESRLAACPEVKTCTIAPEGLRIPGISISAPENLLTLRDCMDEKSIFLATEGNTLTKDERLTALKDSRSSFNKELIQAYNIAADGLKNLKSAEPSPEQFLHQLEALEIAPVLELIPSTKNAGLTKEQRFAKAFKSIAEFCRNFQ